MSNLWREYPETTRFFKKPIQFVNFRMKLVLPYSEPYTEEIKCKSTHFPIIKNTIKRIAFKNACESSIIFQSFVCQYSCRNYVLCAHFLSLRLLSFLFKRERERESMMYRDGGDDNCG